MYRWVINILTILKIDKISYNKKETKYFHFKMLINILNSSRKDNVLTSYIFVVVIERLIDHIESEKISICINTAVRNIDQWSNNWISNLEE